MHVPKQRQTIHLNQLILNGTDFFVIVIIYLELESMIKFLRAQQQFLLDSGQVEVESVRCKRRVGSAGG